MEAWAKGARPLKTPWWASPPLVVLVGMLPLLVAALLVPAEFHWALRRPIKFMDISGFAISVAGLVCFAAACFLASRPNGRAPRFHVADVAHDPTFVSLIVTTSWILAAVTFASYFLWFGGLVFRFDVLKAIALLQPMPLRIRETYETISGVTTLVQAGIVYATVFCIRWFCVPAARPRRIEWVVLALIIVCATFRGFVWGERIALLEVLLPIVLFVCCASPRRVLIALLPLIALVGIVLFFSFAEYFRSWRYYRSIYPDEFWLFMIQRFSGYYITAIDNGAGFLKLSETNWFPVATAEWFWRFPVDFGLDSLARSLGVDRQEYRHFLDWSASREFNNMSGVFAPFVDFGIVGGLIVWGFIGVFVGYLYRGFCSGSIVGLILYPAWYFGVLELMRLSWFFSLRMFTVTLVGVVVIAGLWLLCQRGLHRTVYAR